MTIETDVYDALIADSTVSAIVSTKVYPHPAPPGVANPLISYFMVTGSRIDTLSGINDMQRKLIQINCHADTYSGSKTLAAAVDGALQPLGYLANETDLYDPDTQTFTVAVDFSFLK